MMMRCWIGGLIMSAVVGGITYAAAQNRTDDDLMAARDLAREACSVIGPPDTRQVEDLPLLDTQLKLCKFGATGEIE